MSLKKQRGYLGPGGRRFIGTLGGNAAMDRRIRALSPAAWYQPGVGVTGTFTVSNWADQSGNGRDLAQGTAGNQPIYLPYSGTAYAYLPGVFANYFSTPDSAANSITGDIDLRAYARDSAWDDVGECGLIAKLGGLGSQYAYGLTAEGGYAHFYASEDGSSYAVNSRSTAVIPFANDAAGWLRATYSISTGALKFYTSTDGSSWTQLGTTVAAATVTSIFNSTAVVEAGSIFTGGTSVRRTAIYRAQIYNGIDGTLAVDFSPSTFAETSTNGATAVASTGETWTLNSTGAKPAQIVKSPQIMFDGVNDFLVTSTFNLSQPITIYAVWKQNVWDSTDTIYECSTNTAWYNRITQNGSTPDLKFSAASGGTKISAANANAALGAKVITTTIGNGASGLFQINNTTALTGDYGTFGTTGLQIAADSAGGARWSAITFWEFIMFNAAHTAAQRASVQAYLSARHGIAL